MASAGLDPAHSGYVAIVTRLEKGRLQGIVPGAGITRASKSGMKGARGQADFFLRVAGTVRRAALGPAGDVLSCGQRGCPVTANARHSLQKAVKPALVEFVRAAIVIEISHEREAC